jgi:hypothetical protein
LFLPPLQNRAWNGAVPCALIRTQAVFITDKYVGK